MDETDGELQQLLDALGDADCRAILDVTNFEARSAREVAEACDLATSTAYRKLHQLTDAGLLEERTRIRRSGKHASEYSRLVDEVIIGLDDNGDLDLRVSRRDRDEVPAPVAVVTGD